MTVPDCGCGKSLWLESRLNSPWAHLRVQHLDTNTSIIIKTSLLLQQILFFFLQKHPLGLLESLLLVVTFLNC